MALFSKKQVTEIVGLKPRLIQFYTEEGVVLPEVNTGLGRGKVRKYSKTSVVEFGILKELVAYGMALQTVKKIMKLFRMNFSHSPDALKKFGPILRSGSAIDNWENMSADVFLVVYQKAQGKMEFVISEGCVNPLVAEKLMESASVLIINIGSIISTVRSL